MIENEDIPFPADPEALEFNDSPFTPWRFAKTDKSKSLIAEAIKNVQLYEQHRAPRKRKRKKHDQQTFELTVEAILCDLMNHRLCRREKAIYVTRSNNVLGLKNRYRPRVYGKTFPDILNKLATPELTWIVQELGDADWGAPTKRTTIFPGPRLIDRMDAMGVTLADMGYNNVADPIILKREKEDHWDEGGVVEYQDTDETIRFRRQMREINEWLRTADLDYASDLVSTGPIPDTDGRTVRRIFTQNRFDRGGRLFGGFWQGMKKADRFERLYIDGETVAELDYSQMGPRQLYGIKGIAPEDDDLYNVPGFEDHRSGIKVIFGAMMFQDKPLSKMPQGTREKFAKCFSIADVTGAIERHHPAITGLFYQGIGHYVQFLESEIMVDILLRLKGMGIVALPIHDAIIVPSSRVQTAYQVMLDVFLHHVGFHGSVDALPVPMSQLNAPLVPLTGGSIGGISPTSLSGTTSQLPLLTLCNTSGNSSMEGS